MGVFTREERKQLQVQLTATFGRRRAKLAAWLALGRTLCRISDRKMKEEGHKELPRQVVQAFSRNIVALRLERRFVRNHLFYAQRAARLMGKSDCQEFTAILRDRDVSWRTMCQLLPFLDRYQQLNTPVVAKEALDDKALAENTENSRLLLGVLMEQLRRINQSGYPGSQVIGALQQWRLNHPDVFRAGQKRLVLHGAIRNLSTAIQKVEAAYIAVVSLAKESTNNSDHKAAHKACSGVKKTLQNLERLEL